MKVVLIGAVQSTERALLKLIEHRMNVVGVFGYRADSTEHVSGFTDLEAMSLKVGFSFFPFKNINDNVDAIKTLAPDVIFVIGLSQIVSERILEIPTLYCVGFHPTKLPKGRGRAPLAWMILDQVTAGAATLFVLQKGVDDGPILAQREFSVSENDDVQILIDKTLYAMDEALDKALPELKAGVIRPVLQKEDAASYYGKRAPEDGVIDWNDDAVEISRLIQSAASPYPGAFTYFDIEKIVLNKCEVSKDKSSRGATGRILSSDSHGFTVQCGCGLLVVCDWSSSDWAPRVGMKLGYHIDNEIYEIKKRLLLLEENKNSK